MGGCVWEGGYFSIVEHTSKVAEVWGGEHSVNDPGLEGRHNGNISDIKRKERS